MFDINTAINTAIAAAVAEATKPLVERIAALENNPAQGVDTTLETRLLALEESKGMTAAAFVTYLDNQEWFWEKVSRYITNNSDITVDELHNIKERLSDAEDRLDKITTASDARIQEVVEQALDAHLENANHFDADDIDAAIDAAIERHEENRTHGDEDDIEEMVQRLLNGASISISV